MCPSGLAVSQFEQSANVKFTCKLGKIAAEMLETLQTACWDSGLKRKTAVYDWYNCFKSEQEVLEDEPHGGRTSTSVIAKANSKVKELVHANRQITTSGVANEVSISCGSAQ